MLIQMVKGSYIVAQLGSGRYDSMTIRSNDGKIIAESLSEVASAELVRGFEEFSSNCERGTYVVEAWKQSDFNKSGRKTDVEQRKSYVWGAGSSQPDRMSSPGNSDAVLSLQRELFDLKLEKRMSELENSSQSQMYGMLEKIFMRISAPRPGISQPGPVSAAPSDSVSGNQSADENAKFVALFEQWQKSDDKLMSTIERLATMSREQPEQYRTYRDMLLGNE